WPHERSLVKTLEEKPFALIGVNTNNSEAKKLKEVMDREKLNWRSFVGDGTVEVRRAAARRAAPRALKKPPPRRPPPPPPPPPPPWGLPRRRTPLTPLRLAQAITLPVGLDDLNPMGEAVEQRARQPLAARHLGPLLERQVRRHDQARPLVGPAHHLEEHLPSRLGERHIAQLVQHEQVRPLQLPLHLLQRPLLAPLQQLRHQPGHGEEPHPPALGAGGERQRGRH